VRSDTVAEFRKRRALWWRKIRFSVPVMLLGFLVLLFYGQGVQPEPSLRFWICFAAFVSVAGAIVHITFTWKNSYRCPACEAPVMNKLRDGGDVPFDPPFCPHCGVPLK
jgi:hypothetical protein